MAKLVFLNQGMTGRTHDLNVERTTVGRVEDNTLQIADPSVSSHHGEIILQGSEVLIRDLNSTNGTFINGEKIGEKILKPGQTLRLGQVELKLEVEGATASASLAPSAPAKKTTEARGGVSLSDLEQSGGKPQGFDTVFSKKKKKVGIYVWVIFGVVILIIACLLIYALSLANTHK
ncbi:MAG TPA: FHA domain-containing protein [Verrucomicrobiae bacterium]|nr:FHA domain-containing protein [Verrucomicrobiae bacterium]